MNVLITGAGGQLGRALLATAPGGITVRAATRAELDIADAQSVETAVRAAAAEAVINAAGFTRVDDAESRRAEAERANATGPALLAAACARSGAWLIQVSTDYVFDGDQGRPYATTARPNPISEYGRTKLSGELAVMAALPAQSTVVRTSWLYAAQGRNFLTTMLRLMRERPQLEVVSDQVGAPTSVVGLARALWAVSHRRLAGIHHWCDSGVASWYDFAIAIAEEGVTAGVLPSSPRIEAIAAAEYAAAARRPAYSLLDKRDTERALGMQAPHWRRALRETLSALAAGDRQ